MSIPSLSVHGGRIAALRVQMKAAGLHALLVPSADPHQSEYLPEHWRARAWACGFSGSVGLLAISGERAALLVDGRYLLQAEAELAGADVEIVRVQNSRAPDADVLNWLRPQLPAGAQVAVDGDVLALESARHLAQGLAQAGAVLRIDLDLLAAVWVDRPALPASELWEHALPEAGATRAEKLAALRWRMAALGADHHLSAALDEIAWLTNLRGADVPFNPVFLAYVLVDEQRCRVFVGTQRVNTALRERLAADGIELCGYGEVGAALQSLPDGARVLLEPARVSAALQGRLPAGVQRIIAAPNPMQLLKACRNAQQADHLRAAMAQDGAAQCEFYVELERDLVPAKPGQGGLSELDLHGRITACRARRPGYRGPSFDTIAGFGPHAAMPHYSATAATTLPLDGRGLLLIDSGGHYLGGTTDITRVWPLGGAPNDLQRQDYTRVLKGLIALSRLRFPRGTMAPMLDAIARAPLWAEALDYDHGTGHGVGHYLNVHEGPQLFAQCKPQPEMVLEPGMVISVEPGVYRRGQWGVRLENLVLCVPSGESGFGEFLAFETLSLCPFDTSCLALDLLDAVERRWLDDYHATVRRRLAPLLSGPALDWLLTRTLPLHALPPGLNHP
ncbi:MAG TPA: aminopeptidase P family protein [Roseateles sp.]|uniref:aminopeptidase P family protein n=1 Tax=Roseateles sp. TaxID=1971397 RepID=UPI002ED85B8E